MRESIHALKMQSANGPGRGKPVLISSLANHAITFERSTYTKIAFLKMKPV